MAPVSPDYLIRTFRSVFGETPHRYLQRRRIERAMFLLRTTDLDVTEVCVSVEFTRFSTFSTFTHPSVRRSTTTGRRTSVRGWKLSYQRLSSLYVLDQDQALDFYVGVLGLEVGTDTDLGFVRWLTVKVPGDDREILLERPGPPAHDPQTAEQVRELLSKGAAGGWIAFQVDDVDTVHAELVEKGVEITQPPTDQPYGRDLGLRDPFGNHLRMGNVTV
ncbi:MAG: VOC family protein [Nocardioidaceae bacterium]